jgi:hypothetical protein
MDRGRHSHVRTVERIDDPHDADERVLEHLAARGNLTEPREVRHFLLLPDRPAADRVAAELNEAEWLTHVEESDDCWLVVASAVRSLTSERVRRTRALFAALATRHGGLYDGWETATV